MKPFHNSRYAKEFVISRIVDEAQRENIPLSDAERRMLYFSEQNATSGGEDVSDDSDGVRDPNEYEEKIARLIRNADRRARNESNEVYNLWASAIRLLKLQDHYIVVMLDRAGLRPPGDFLKLWATGFAIVCFLLTAMFLAILVSSEYLIDPSREAVGSYIWATFAVLAIVYGLARWILGGETLDALTTKLWNKVFPLPKHEK